MVTKLRFLSSAGALAALLSLGAGGQSLVVSPTAFHHSVEHKSRTTSGMINGGNTLTPMHHGLPLPTSPTKTQSGHSSTVFNVTTFGASPTGDANDTTAFQTAIDRAEAVHGTVLVPTGTYSFDSMTASPAQIVIDAPIHLEGEKGAVLVDRVGFTRYGHSSNLIEIENSGSGTTVSGLTLNSAKYEAGTDIMDFASHTTLENLNVQAAKSTNTYNPNAFGIRVIAICNPSNFATIYRVDNVVKNVTINGLGSYGQTELDFSCQVGSSMNNVTISGNGLDSYISKDITISNATITAVPTAPNPYTWVINDSKNVTLDHITTYGSGGYIVQHLHNEPATNITVENETMKDPTGVLFIGDVDGLALKSDSLANIRISPAISASNIAMSDSSLSGEVECYHVNKITDLSGLACPS